MRHDFIDFPTAWDIQRAGNLVHTDPVCSAVQTGGAMLCDCGALYVEWEILKAEFPEDTSSHGTYSGYQAHKRNGDDTCQPCRDANAAYNRAYRAAHPEYVARAREQTLALARAKTRVAHAHPDEVLRAYDEELQRKPKEASST